MISFTPKHHDGFPQNHGFTPWEHDQNHGLSRLSRLFYREGWNRGRFQHGSRGQGPRLRILGTGAGVCGSSSCEALGEGIPMDPWFEMGKDRGTIWLFNIAMV